MRIAVLSDVHSNLHALDAVLGEVDAGRFDAIWFLGDLVGYGPKPNECAALLQERAAICLAGNHDLVVLGKIPIDAFAGEAAAAARWTQTVLDEPARGFLGTLQPRAAAPGAELFHGSPRDPVWDYVLSDESAASAFALTEAPLVLVGHSHVALEISDGGDLRGEPAPAGTRLELGTLRRLLNPGSVGQPRDGDPRAAWLEIDFETGWATFRRTEYPVEQTQGELRELGLPEALAARLEYGI
ncbi:MAG TPA: metallophosphoesterase family protein [Gaiellaceae bacterium]|nr:metallophosphoesterase family protein [Gaiellaceae bacterium]